MNEALLVIMLFTTNPSGTPQNAEVVTHSFETLEECNLFGNNLRYYYLQATGKSIPSNIKTLSYCVHYTEFAK
tara:strand:- start:361 stop:579 length:219 start_codon:yes stop_codon:yes gene_type:complete